MARVYNYSAPVREVVVRRQFPTSDTLQLYSSTEILASAVDVSFEGEGRDDFGGLTKEVYTCFRAQAYQSFFFVEKTVRRLSCLCSLRYA